MHIWYISNGHSANLRVRTVGRTCAHYARRYYGQRKDTCPTLIPRICAYVSHLLKVDFWIHGPVVTDTSYSDRLLFVGLPIAFRCAMYLLPLDHVSKNQLSINQNLFNACANSRNDRWTCILPLAIVSPCIVCTSSTNSSSFRNKITSTNRSHILSYFK